MRPSRVAWHCRKVSVNKLKWIVFSVILFVLGLFVIQDAVNVRELIPNTKTVVILDHFNRETSEKSVNTEKIHQTTKKVENSNIWEERWNQAIFRRRFNPPHCNLIEESSNLLRVKPIGGRIVGSKVAMVIFITS